MSYYIFPMLETQSAISDHVDDPDNVRKLLHLEALLQELLDNVKEETMRKGLRNEAA